MAFGTKASQQLAKKLLKQLPSTSNNSGSLARKRQDSDETCDNSSDDASDERRMASLVKRVVMMDIYDVDDDNSILSSDDDDDDVPTPLLTSNYRHSHSASYDGVAYNFEDVSWMTSTTSHPQGSLSLHRVTEPTSCYQEHSLAQGPLPIVSPQALSSSPSNKPSYRWSLCEESTTTKNNNNDKMIQAEETELAEATEMEPFFLLGGSSTTDGPIILRTAPFEGADGDDGDNCSYLGDDECEENVSLLRAKCSITSSSSSSPKLDSHTRNSSRLLQKSSLFLASVGLGSSSKGSTTNKATFEEDSIHLMSSSPRGNRNSSSSWSERQLAFDLDSVHDYDDENDNHAFDNTLWMLQPDDDLDQAPPPPPPLAHWVAPPPLSQRMDDDDYGRSSSALLPPLLETANRALSSSATKMTTASREPSSFSQQQQPQHAKFYEPPQRRTSTNARDLHNNAKHTKKNGRHQPQQHHHQRMMMMMPHHRRGSSGCSSSSSALYSRHCISSSSRGSSGNHHLRYATRLMGSSSSSGISNSSSRRSSRRRRGSWSKGANFASDLTTVAERPSEEDAEFAAACMADDDGDEGDPAASASSSAASTLETASGSLEEEDGHLYVC